MKGLLLNNKEILLSYINTLTDRECKSLYLYLKDINDNKKREYFYFDINGDRVEENGIVKLTPKQYYKLVYMWEKKEKVTKCISLLAKHLETKNIVTKVSHYNMLIGWVERYYHKLLRYGDIQGEGEQRLQFCDIKNPTQAREYIEKVPESIRQEDSYCLYLVNKFGQEILK